MRTDKPLPTEYVFHPREDEFFDLCLSIVRVLWLMILIPFLVWIFFLPFCFLGADFTILTITAVTVGVPFALHLLCVDATEQHAKELAEAAKLEHMLPKTS